MVSPSPGPVFVNASEQHVYLPGVKAAVLMTKAHLLTVVMPAAVDRDGVTRATAGNEVLIYEERAVVVVERALPTHKPECVTSRTCTPCSRSQDRPATDQRTHGISFGH